MTEADTCVLCRAAPHPECEVWGVVEMCDPWGDFDGEVPVCLDHYEAIQQYVSNKTEAKI